MTSPGVWVPTTPPIFAQYARAKPWVLTSADQFRPGPPPQLASALYARDYNETKALGGAKSTTRTAAQNEAVKYWTQANLPFAWEVAARQLSAAKGLGLADNARLFALLNVGIANTFITDWDAKFTYNFWRPVTAIRNGDMDGNDATERDAGWIALNDTPMHPEYPSQAAIISGLAVAVLESQFGPKPAIPFTMVDFFDANLKRPFNNIAELDEEQKNVRVWGGIHFRNSLEVGNDMGKKIAAYLDQQLVQAGTLGNSMKKKSVVWMAALGCTAAITAQSALAHVKVTPLGGHDGELCPQDRALIFEDPNGTRILFDPVVRSPVRTILAWARSTSFWSAHMHGDHVGNAHNKEPNSGSCDKPDTSVSALPNSNAVNIALPRKRRS